MPIYEYVCEKCGQSLEVIQRLADAKLEECPKCGGHLRKKVSAPAFQFKGTGWYVTDYGKKGSDLKSGSSSESGGGDDSSASSAKKTESKSEPKTESKSDSKSDSKSESKSEPAGKPSG
jgi:putative FmdB family regulatory protein